MAVTSQPKGGSEEDYISGLTSIEKESFLQVQQDMPTDLKAACGSGNTYIIRNIKNEAVLRAVEETRCICRWFCGPQRSFNITIYDLQERPVLVLDRRGCRCDWWCCLDCCCCQHSLTVKDGRDTVIGSVRQRWHLFNLRADVRDEEGEVLYRIKGPCCPCRCCTDITVDICDKKNHAETGYICKQWGEKSKWVNMDHEFMNIQFPEYCSVRDKALLLGSAFLVHFMYFEMS